MPPSSFSPHDIPHLFNCVENMTNFIIEDLWTKPIEFLKLDEDP